MDSIYIFLSLIVVWGLQAEGYPTLLLFPAGNKSVEPVSFTKTTYG
jgi:hypothetical protein